MLAVVTSTQSFQDDVRQIPIIIIVIKNDKFRAMFQEHLTWFISTLQSTDL